MMRKTLIIAAVFALVAAGSGQARSIPNTATPQSMQQLIGCRSIADSAQRLACYDREAAAVSKAIASRDLVVIDKARATAARRSLFGFSIPNFGGLFGGGENDVKQIESTIASVGHNPEGGWLLKLADGSTWTQVDDAELGLAPERGEKVTVSRGSLGSFYIQLGKQPGFKVKRIG
jgi:hypothetical protein